MTEQTTPNRRGLLCLLVVCLATALATGAIDQGLPLANVPEDYDRQIRPYGLAPDIGADELIPEPATLALLALGGVTLLCRKHGYGA